MRQTSFAEMHCSLAQSLQLVGDWWSPLILRDLWLGLHRFDELVEDLGISRNLLTERLTHLVDHGVVARAPYQQRPVRHGYELTQAGRELVPVLLALTAWGDRWATPPAGVPLRLRHETCGHDFVPTIACDHCGRPVDADTVAARPGPGGRQARGTRLIAPLIAARAAA